MAGTAGALLVYIHKRSRRGSPWGSVRGRGVGSEGRDGQQGNRHGREEHYTGRVQGGRMSAKLQGGLAKYRAHMGGIMGRGHET